MDLGAEPRGGGRIQNHPWPVGVLLEMKEDGSRGDDLGTGHLAAA
jgi:hypothetical protein